MLTTQLPSVPRTWCPPTILVFICTKHDILGPVKAEGEDSFMLPVRWMYHFHLNGKTFIKKLQKETIKYDLFGRARDRRI